ncbi:ribokinase [Alteribacter lacisalsi]|uniref:Ribokinase n=1 Tax=Alteribacter lacisalsi TaxID=2045244 RepID=A0A2W0H6W8_9BACI|nr:ribokinase [Alteribacter lacisalsi]PYZ96476.1 ribokinase [Alteribacter lacisalsi]
MADVLVVGSYIADLMSRTPHMPKAGETVLGGPFQMGPGGKGGNQAVAAARLGAHVTMVTKVGEDPFGEEAFRNFSREGINTNWITRDPDEATGAALIAVDDEGENMIIVAPGACGKLTAADVAAADEAFTGADVVLVQLETAMEAVEAAVNLAERHGKPLILNPAPFQEVRDDLLAKAAYITPNETEARLLTGIDVQDETTAHLAARKLAERGVGTVIITLGRQGCYVFTDGEGTLVPGVKVNAVDTTGAGDAFNGALAVFLAEGDEVHDACRKANRAAALSVTRPGTSPAMAYREELDSL